MDPTALKILEKWKLRLSDGWDASDSDVLRHLDAALEAHERERRAREGHPHRRVGIGPR